MIMRARNDGSVIIFELEGHLDFETTQQFEETCTSIIQKNPGRQFVFNMEKLKFVGSSGINQFIKVLKDFNTGDIKPRLCHLSSEFVKIFKAYQATRNPFEIFEDEPKAIASFIETEATKRSSRKRAPLTN